MTQISGIEGIEQQPLYAFTEKAYLDYSMYVILDRALPHIGDGLKPVQRRIVYAMSELGLSAVSRHKKSARTVGDVLGKFHPHGDSACYEAMVLMAQSFSYRYPLVDGQGNWGSQDDPKSFAAMRYTEAKLSKYAEVLLSEIGQGTVEWAPNFDGTLEEPLQLPARLPNILLNGGSGIAVGMATDIPPHNIREVGGACIHLIDNPKASLADMLSFIPAPDFPTQAEIITPKHDIEQIYQGGTGSVKQRAVYYKENGEIVVTALPYQVSGTKIQEQIAQQMRDKKLPMLEDLRDESDHENPTRLVLVPRSSRVDCDAMMNHLFASTDLERSYRINLNMIGLDGRPRVKNLLNILKEWLVFRKTTVTRRLQFRLDKVLARLHVLDAYMIAFLNIDEVIKIIREHEDAKKGLIKRFEVTDIQADAILDLKLRHLAKLEEMKIKSEQNGLADERDYLEKMLGSDTRLKTLLKTEIKADIEKFGDVRRSPLRERAEAVAMKETDMLPSEAVTIILSEKGWVRQGKGHEVDTDTLNYKSGDSFLDKALGRTNQFASFLDSTGRTYGIAIHGLPSARSHGEPVTGKISPPPGARFVAVMAGDPDRRYLLASDAGYGFIVQLKELVVRNKSGKAVLKLPKGALALMPRAVVETKKSIIAAITNEGRMLVFPVKELPELSRGKGNKIIGIPSKRVEAREEFVVALQVLTPKQSLVLKAGKRKLILKPADLKHYQGERGRRGNKLPRGFQKVDGVEVN